MKISPCRCRIVAAAWMRAGKGLRFEKGKMMKLSNGATYCFDSNGNRVCTGSQMGRRDVKPASVHPKLRLRRLPFVDGAYDRWGAYWGSPNNVWMAWDDEGTQLFRRGDTREAVKGQITKEWPLARFYR